MSEEKIDNLVEILLSTFVIKYVVCNIRIYIMLFKKYYVFIFCFLLDCFFGKESFVLKNLQDVERGRI